MQSFEIILFDVTASHALSHFSDELGQVTVKEQCNVVSHLRSAYTKWSLHSPVYLHNGPAIYERWMAYWTRWQIIQCIIYCGPHASSSCRRQDSHYNEVTLWRLKSKATPLFVQSFVRAHIEDNIKAPRHWLLWGESTDDRWVPLTKSQWCRKCFHLMTSPWSTKINQKNKSKANKSKAFDKNSNHERN